MQTELVWQWCIYEQTKVKWGRKGKLTCFHVIAFLWSYVLSLYCHYQLFISCISDVFICHTSCSHLNVLFMFCLRIASISRSWQMNTWISQRDTKARSVKLIKKTQKTKNRADLDSLPQLMGLRGLVLLLMQLKRGGNSQRSASKAT